MQSLTILAEQLTTAYELAKDEGLQGDELNAVVVRHLAAAIEEAVAEPRTVYGVFMVIETEDGDAYYHLWGLHQTEAGAQAELTERRRWFVEGTMLEIQELSVEA